MIRVVSDQNDAWYACSTCNYSILDRLLLRYYIGINCTEFSNFNKFVNDIDFKLFLKNPDCLPCKCNNSPFADSHHKIIVTGDLEIINHEKCFKKTFY